MSVDINQIYGKSVIGQSSIETKIQELYNKHKKLNYNPAKFKSKNDENGSNNTAQNFFLNDSQLNESNSESSHELNLKIL